MPAEVQQFADYKFLKNIAFGVQDLRKQEEEAEEEEEQEQEEQEQEQEEE
jgi:hypothetical protein